MAAITGREPITGPLRPEFTLPAEYEREDYQTPALLEVRILADSVSGCRYRWLALPPRSRAVCRIGGRIAGHGLSSPAVALWLWRFSPLCRRRDVA